jgi:4-hydroxy-tetrahydrodipicolinate synthase
MKKKTVFCGVGTALVTPFRDGAIDYAALKRLIEWQIGEGVDALIIGGTTGEAATLTEYEREALYARSAELIGGRVKLVLGTGTNDTQAAVKLTRIAARSGCDAALVVTPYYNKGTEEGVFRHYSTIAECSELPIILYNVPSRTGVNLGINLLSRLSENERIVGLKEASDSIDRLVEIAKFRDTLPLYAGNDSQIYPTLALGGVGAISVVSNLCPRRVSDIFTAYRRGDAAGSLGVQHELLPLIKALFTETNPAPVKYALELMGKCSGELRLPLSEVRESTKEIIQQELEKIK